MKKEFILVLIYCIISLKAISPDNGEDIIELYIFKDNHTVCIYNGSNKDSIVGKIRDNAKAGLLNGFYVLEKQDSMIKVIAWNTINNKKINGWIKITETCINGRERNHVYELYQSPDYNSKKLVLNSDWLENVYRWGKNVKITRNIDSNFQVFDISDKWLKVKVKGKDKDYIQWLPKEYQCHDIGGECGG